MHSVQPDRNCSRTGAKRHGLWFSIAMALVASGAQAQLEEVVVTAQKREESLQSVPLAVSALGEESLQNLGIDSLGDLSSGYLPTLKVQPYYNSPSMLMLTLRGVGSGDPEQITKEAGVGVYIDGVYLGRTQGLSTSLTDLERIEVLRGPQGTLYGRNSLGGAVNLISRRPTGELGLEQTLTAGSYGRLRSLTHVDLPAVGSLSAKFSYLHNRSDGWVKNDYPGSRNFYYESNHGGRLALHWEPVDEVSIDYAFERARSKTAMGYFQYTHTPERAPGFTFFDPSLIDRPTRTRARFGVPLKPTITDTEAHTLIAEWQLTERLGLKSITAYRELDEDLFTNYGGVFSTGLNIQRDTHQHQWSQELQLLGETDQFQYVAGLYWFDEKAHMDNLEFGTIAFHPANGPNALPVAVGPELFVLDPGTRVKAETESWAVFGQATWTPAAEILQNRLQLTLGARYTNDRKRAHRSLNYGMSETARARFSASRVDPMASVSWDITEDLTTYVKWSTAYLAGGTNLRSVDFQPYDEEKLTSTEIGIKSEWLDRRLRLNAAVFKTVYKDKQLDFPNPANPVDTATINAQNGNVDISGLEVEIEAQLLSSLWLSVSYNYLDATIKDQLDPFTDEQARFVMKNAPRHSGSAQLRYDFPTTRVGQPRFTLTYTGSAAYYQNPRNLTHYDAWDLFHARLALADIRVDRMPGAFEVSLWINNLTNEKYIVNGISQAISDSALYGEPRTTGVDLRYRF